MGGKKSGETALTGAAMSVVACDMAEYARFIYSELNIWTRGVGLTTQVFVKGRIKPSGRRTGSIDL
jgi:hypothetical protein